MRNLLILLFVLLPSVLFGQNRIENVTVKTDPNIISDSQWFAAKKLSTNLDVVENRKRVFPGPYANSRVPQNIKTGAITNGLCYWRFEVKKIIDDNSMTLQIGDFPTFVLEGYPTTDIADDESVVIADRVEAMGTRDIGGKKLRVFRMLTAEETRAIEDKLDTDGYLEYRYTTGETFRGKFIRQDENEAVFLLPSGVEKSESFADLDHSAKQQVIVEGERLGIKVKIPNAGDANKKPAKKEPKKRKNSN